MRPVRALRLRRAALAFFVATLLSASGLGAPADGDPATLTGESVLGLGAGLFHVLSGSTCASDGSGTIVFTASGTTSGPFPGTITQTGSVTLGPTPAPIGAISFLSPVTQFSSTFTIVSGSTTITGTETLGEREDTLPFGTFDFVNAGECFRGAGTFTANQFSVGLRYDATINTPGGSFLDNGFGHAYGAENRFLQPATLVDEGFVSLSGVTAPGAPTNVVAVAGDGTAAVSWVPPVSSGGNPIRNYDVTVSPGGRTVVACANLSTDVTCHYTDLLVTGLTNGVSYSFSVTARNAVGMSPASGASNTVTPLAGNPPPAAATALSTPAQPTTVSTGSVPDADGTVATITVPAGTAGGIVSIVQGGVPGPAPAGYTLLDRQTTITAPNATAADPLVLTFSVGGSLLAAAGLDETTVQLFRDGVPIGPCDQNTAVASPDPCVASRLALDGGGAEITVRSSHASVWNFGKRSLHFTVSGLFQPVANPPAVNTVKAGSAVPVKFSLAGYQGLNVMRSGYPKSVTVPCEGTTAAAAIDETATAGGSSLSYDPTSDRYTYVWKTEKSWISPPGGPCRQLIVSFIDGSVLTARFSFRK